MFILSFLYTLMLSMDANFRLKLKDRHIDDDKRLGKGLSYYVDESRYDDVISRSNHVVEVSVDLIIIYVSSDKTR